MEKKTTMDEVHEFALKWQKDGDRSVFLITYDADTDTSSLSTLGRADNQAAALVGTLMQNPNLYSMLQTSLELTDRMKALTKSADISNKVAS